jgi:leucyl aminopeptidase (aminopeptidase T)
MSETPSKLQRDAARNIVTKCLKVRAGENAIIESWDHTMPMASAMVDEVRRVGGKVLLVQNDEDAWWRAIDRGQGKLLGESSAPEWAALKAADVYVNFWGPGDADRIEQDSEDALDVAFAWNSPWYAVARKVGLRGVRMTEGFVTSGRAKKWGVDRVAWKESLTRACLVDPQETAKKGARLSKALSRGKKVRITHSNGTDLEVGLARIAPRVTDGRPHPYHKGDPSSGMVQQMPAGTLDVALDSKTAEGSFRANRRTNVWWNWHSGGVLEFAGGKLTSYSLDYGEERVSRGYQSATAGKDRASLLKLGLNPAARDIPNLETIESGSVSLQIGTNQFVGGSNTSNFFTWFTLAGSEIAIDGTPVIRAGKVL